MSIPDDALLLLDTTVFIHLARDDVTGRQILQEYALDRRSERPLFSTISEGEALAICLLRRWGDEKQQRLLGLFTELVRVEPGHPAIVKAYAELHASSARGLNIGQNDMWIAATAKITGAIVVTCDKDFLRVPSSFVRTEYVQEGA